MIGDRAVFLDKDGTLVVDVPYNVDPDLIRLAPGAEAGLPLLRDAGFRLFVMSNQSGVALGLFPESALLGVEARVRELLAEFGVALDGFLYCPHHPEGRVEPYARPCHCRKPAPGMIWRAARDRGLSTRRSWLVGDILDDIEAGRRAGCRTVLIDNGNETEWLLTPGRRPHHTVADLAEAARMIVAADGIEASMPRGMTADGVACPRPRGHGGGSTGHAHADVGMPPRSLVASDATSERGPAMNRWALATNVLCVRLDAMGDVLMTTPAIRALKESHPDRRITLLTSPSGAGAARLVPEVDDVWTYESPWMKATPSRSDGGIDLAMIERIRSGGFDAAVIFTVFSQNPLPAALLCYLADIPLRLAHCRENPYQLLTDWVAETDSIANMRHEVHRQLDLVGTVGARTADERLSMQVPDEARAAAEAWQDAFGIGEGDPWVVIHPGSTAPSRRYAPEGFAEVARGLWREQGFRVIFTGDASERGLVESIRAAMGGPSESLAGRLDLGELAALIERAPLLIANNTGPVHVAAAVGTPVVVLYALTNPQHTPWGVPSVVLNHDVPCRFCFKSVCPEGHHDCLRKVAPDQILRAAHDLLAIPAFP